MVFFLGILLHILPFKLTCHQFLCFSFRVVEFQGGVHLLYKWSVKKYGSLNPMIYAPLLFVVFCWYFYINSLFFSLLFVSGFGVICCMGHHCRLISGMLMFLFGFSWVVIRANKKCFVQQVLRRYIYADWKSSCVILQPMLWLHSEFFKLHSPSTFCNSYKAIFDRSILILLLQN